jgi:hypothetical protein
MLSNFFIQSHKVVKEDPRRAHATAVLSAMRIIFDFIPVIVILVATITPTLGVTVLSRLSGWARNAQYGSPLGYPLTMFPQLHWFEFL